ncbi:D-alanine--D-alanine ligase [Prochlorococcus marinus XMU1412]|uniref:D-alanine--D-alanine ligase family protein n=1 Tax=Prochlorococcus marinus TaxID=1219 RepID=UPI001ADCC772|nr:D-alanine--D-alanine ligase family protein [Prochlorococcus marinus]MBO8240620.1 D-alanine--D-alanine ligase [Prochlorococcus marinus XMU1412]MBW3071855.1 D-alanine--D-alanine ligase [Prochlorococcus marinus str. MU1412]
MIGGQKKCIGLIFGGHSNEHEVSISSAKTVFQAFNAKINKERFIVKTFYINKNGDWLDSEISEKILIGEIENYKTKKQEIFNQEKINFLDGIEFQNIDVWFPLLHGFNGEDGSIHGLIRFTKKPLVGCGIIGSALGMDKILMKTIFSNLKLPQVKYLVFQNEDLNDKQVKNKIINEILKKLKFPVFVKPSNSGSSLGISKVKNESEILLALEKAREIDPRILIEEGLEVREIECGIIGNSKLLTSEIGEVNYKSDWYDYDSKYKSKNKIIIPAEIDSKIKKEIKEIAIKSCRALNIFGFARVDFFLEKSSNKILLNEINTIPGFTKNSMFPMLWEASGLKIEQLVAKLVEISLDL